VIFFYYKIITFASLTKYRSEIYVLLYIVVDYVFLELTLVYINIELISSSKKRYKLSSIRFKVFYYLKLYIFP
jgi:hypothetical protein